MFWNLSHLARLRCTTYYTRQHYIGNKQETETRDKAVGRSPHYGIGRWYAPGVTGASNEYDLFTRQGPALRCYVDLHRSFTEKSAGWLTLQKRSHDNWVPDNCTRTYSGTTAVGKRLHYFCWHLCAFCRHLMLNSSCACVRAYVRVWIITLVSLPVDLCTRLSLPQFEKRNVLKVLLLLRHC